MIVGVSRTVSVHVIVAASVVVALKVGF